MCYCLFAIQASIFTGTVVSHITLCIPLKYLTTELQMARGADKDARVACDVIAALSADLRGNID